MAQIDSADNGLAQRRRVIGGLSEAARPEFSQRVVRKKAELGSVGSVALQFRHGALKFIRIVEEGYGLTNGRMLHRTLEHRGGREKFVQDMLCCTSDRLINALLLPANFHSAHVFYGQIIALFFEHLLIDFQFLADLVDELLPVCYPADVQLGAIRKTNRIRGNSSKSLAVPWQTHRKWLYFASIAYPRSQHLKPELQQTGRNLDREGHPSAGALVSGMKVQTTAVAISPPAARLRKAAPTPKSSATIPASAVLKVAPPPMARPPSPREVV